MVRTVTLNLERMRHSVGQNFATATELANYLVAERGLPFRTCHEIVGSLVGTLVREGKTLDDHARVCEILTEHGQELTVEQVASIVDPAQCLERQRSLGSTGPASVLQMMGKLNAGVDASEVEVAARRDGLQDAYATTMRVVETLLSGDSLSQAPLS